jgi:hypothetical protein
LSVKFHPDENWLVTGHADKSVRIHQYKYGNHEPWETSQLATLPVHQGGVVSAEFHPTIMNRLLTSSLDATFAVIDLFLDDAEQPYRVLQQTRDHTKFVVRAKWHPTQRDMFVTAGHDHICTLWHRESESQPWSKRHSWQFAHNVEAVEFTRDGTQLIVAARQVPHLTYVDLASMCQSEVSVNALGDAHVSFNVLDLAVDDRHVIATTDKGRAIMYKLGTPFQVRNFYGLDNDEYSTPRVQLDHQGHLYAVRTLTRVTPHSPPHRPRKASRSASSISARKNSFMNCTVIKISCAISTTTAHVVCSPRARTTKLSNSGPCEHLLNIATVQRVSVTYFLLWHNKYTTTIYIRALVLHLYKFGHRTPDRSYPSGSSLPYKASHYCRRSSRKQDDT